MTPVPFLTSSNVLRLFLTFCDKDNVGRIGFVDLNPRNPSEIIGISSTPALDIGIDGAFDDSGVLPSALLSEEGRLYMFYSAYQRQVKVPYTILSGIAVSENDGETFTRLSNVPLLERTEAEMFQRSAIEIMKADSGYRIWYTSGTGWCDNGIKVVPRYDLKTIFSKNLLRWNGEPCLSLALKDDEYGLTMPQVFFEHDTYKMYYSIRSVSKGYRLGYAESKDGISFSRKDEEMEIDVSPEGFDSEMICFGKTFTFEGRTFLFYSGNHYGMGGIGYAELVKE